MTYLCFPGVHNPSQKVSPLQGENLLLKEQILSFEIKWNFLLLKVYVFTLIAH